jgi:hypothetical protein
MPLPVSSSVRPMSDDRHSASMGPMTAIRLGTVGAVVLVTTLLLTVAHGAACWVAAVPLAVSTVVAAVLAGHARTGGRTD